MTPQKIKHPFQVPDDFFESFGPEILDKIKHEAPTKKSKAVLLTVMKYAAIVVLSFLLGRASINLGKQITDSSEKNELLSVDAVYSQVSDDDINDFILENASSDLLK
jgi:hypothetical protein